MEAVRAVSYSCAAPLRRFSKPPFLKIREMGWFLQRATLFLKLTPDRHFRRYSLDNGHWPAVHSLAASELIVNLSCTPLMCHSMMRSGHRRQSFSAVAFAPNPAAAQDIHRQCAGICI